MRDFFVSRRGARLGALTCLALTLGCGAAGPKTHPVKGLVVFKNQPGVPSQLVGGTIWFQSTADPNVMAMGTIDEDGSFTMSAVLQKEQQGYPGVLPGVYQARVQPPHDVDRKPGQGPIHAKYGTFDKSGLRFLVPGTEDLVIELDGPGR